MDCRLEHKTWKHNFYKKIGGKLLDIGLDDEFLNLALRAKETKAKKKQAEMHQPKSFCTAKKTINKMKRQPTRKKEILEKHIYDKGLISKIYKELIQLNSKHTIWFKNKQRIWIDVFPNTDIQMTNTYMKRCSTSLIIRKVWIKPQWGITSQLSEWLL